MKDEHGEEFWTLMYQAAMNLDLIENALRAASHWRYYHDICNTD